MNGFNQSEWAQVSRHSLLVAQFEEVVNMQLPLFEARMLVGLVVDQSKVIDARNVNRIYQIKQPVVKIAKLMKRAIQRFALQKLQISIPVTLGDIFLQNDFWVIYISVSELDYRLLDEANLLRDLQKGTIPKSSSSKSYNNENSRTDLCIDGFFDKNFSLIDHGIEVFSQDGFLDWSKVQRNQTVSQIRRIELAVSEIAVLGKGRFTATANPDVRDTFKNKPIQYLFDPRYQGVLKHLSCSPKPICLAFEHVEHIDKHLLQLVLSKNLSTKLDRMLEESKKIEEKLRQLDWLV
jgi:hypothetical protein